MSMNKRELLVKRNVFSMVPAVLVLCGATALSTNVQAASYAVSTNTITNFGITFSSPTAFPNFTLSSDAATQNSTITGKAAVMDAPASCISCSYNNSFTPHGMSTVYSYGDAQIQSTNVLQGVGNASAIGEASAANGTSSGFGINTMVGAFTITTPTTVNFSFNAYPYMQTQSATGGVATANINMTITILDLSNKKVFSWAPNGLVDTTAGETSDPFSLNMGLGSMGNNIPSSYNKLSGGIFAAHTNLAAGSYKMNILMKDSVFVSAVPVPAAAWLLGSGLIGLVSIARRKAG